MKNAVTWTALDVARNRVGGLVLRIAVSVSGMTVTVSVRVVVTVKYTVIGCRIAMNQLGRP
jgi:hypothetical protein